jgi:hypothetical protein
MEIKQRISKSLYTPNHNASRVMQLSHNLNARADVLKELLEIHKNLNSAIMFMEKHNDRKALDKVYIELDYLIKNERNKLLQETQSPKG